MEGSPGPTRGEAFGAPGLPPRWTRGNKDGVGTAYSADSPLWYTLGRGIVNEVYFPRIDRPQIRDLQFLITDGQTFFHEEKRHLTTTGEPLDRHALGYRFVGKDPLGRYTIRKEVFAAPHLPALLERVTFEASPEWRSKLRLFALCAPHLDGGGAGNTARRLDVAGRAFLSATKDETALALGASVPFSRLSCGFVGRSDGWTDLSDNYALDWEFDSATHGNVALTAEIPVETSPEFTLVLALGRGLPHATTVLLQALASPYEATRERFVEQWQRACRHLKPLGRSTSDHGRLLHASYSVLLAHEDKAFPGAFIASLSIPWGSSRGDEERGGYHLVWTRDLVHVATGLLAAGNVEAPLRALVYLASRQRNDGGFAQNFWISGEPYWTGLQLDEVSHPILLAGRLAREKALEGFDPYPMVRAAAGFVVRNGPASPEDRWEEVAGYSPSTLAVQIAALVVAADMADEQHDEGTATFLREYADFLEAHLEEWTTASGAPGGGPSGRRYVRVRPPNPENSGPADDGAEVTLPNQPPDVPGRYPFSEIADAGFLELVRYGIRRADDPTVVASVAAADRALRVETPFGPAWRRYTHDGYGERPDGAPFEGWGQGRAWPLLTGERGHFELAAGRDARPFAEAMERFARGAGLLPEQVWDEPDRPEQHLSLGRPTGSAMPLAWAHAEYLCLLRSLADGRPFDRLPGPEQRYAERRRPPPSVEVWKPNHRTRTVRRGATLRILSAEPFRLHWSRDGWSTAEDTPSAPTELGVDYVDLTADGAAIVFTFLWTGSGRWEGQDYTVAVSPAR